MEKRSLTVTWPAITVMVLMVGLLLTACQPMVPNVTQPMAAPTSSGIVKQVLSAPIVADGAVAGAKTDVIINLDVSMDPQKPGKSLLAGNHIRVTLPDEFVNSGEPALAGVTSGPDCVPANMLCTTSVMLSGWPQRPIAPPTYELSFEDSNTLVITALQDLVASPPEVPGIKQIHLVFQSFTNPDPGLYWIEVQAETGPNGSVEQGTALLEIQAEPTPHIAVTSVFNEGAPNSIYQNAAPGELTPLPYDFLLWDYDNLPLTGVTVAPFAQNQWMLVQGGRVVGFVDIEAPSGATGHRVYSEEASAQVNAPISKAPTARLSVFFQVGSLPGHYVATFRLLDGNAVQMVVDVAG